MKREPQLVNPTGPRPEVLGISGGLTNLAALAIATDFDSLYDAVLEGARVFARICRLTLVRSRAMEDCPSGAWGWAVLGILPDDLRKVLEQFQQSMVSEIANGFLTYRLIYSSKGNSADQESKGRCDRRPMEHCHWTTVRLRAISQPMSRREESPQESVEYPRPSAPRQGIPGGRRLHCWKFRSAGHSYPP